MRDPCDFGWHPEDDFPPDTSPEETDLQVQVKALKEELAVVKTQLAILWAEREMADLMKILRR